MLHIKRLVFAYFSAVDCSFDKEIFTAQVIHFHLLSSNNRLFNIFSKMGGNKVPKSSCLKFRNK